MRIAFTDLRDIGKYVAKILADPRTLNRSVLAYTEVSTINQAYDLIEEMSGEEAPRNYVSFLLLSLLVNPLLIHPSTLSHHPVKQPPEEQ